MKKVTAVMLAAAAIGTGARRAQAQTPGGQGDAFLQFEVGAQPQQRTLDSATSFSLYDETATVRDVQPIRNGPVFGASGGYRFRPSFGVGLAVGMFRSRASAGSVTATIPNFAFANRPSTVTASANSLEHWELGVHLQALWFHRLNDKFDLVLGGGPSLMNVRHDYLSASIPAGTQNLVSKENSETVIGFGFNAGGDVTYSFASHAGLGLFARYAGGSVDVGPISNLKVGGFQTGLAFRVH